MSVKVKLKKSPGNWFRAYIMDTEDEEQFIRVSNVLNSQPVAVSDKRNSCVRMSLYHYQTLIRALHRGGYRPLTTRRLIKAHKRLLKSVNREFGVMQLPKLWSSDDELKPHDYQMEAAEKVLSNRKFIVGDEMGLGKTIEAMLVILRAFEIGYSRALVVVQASLKYQWYDEFLKFTKLSPEQVIVSGTSTSVFKCRLNPEEKAPTIASKKCKACAHYKQCSQIKKNPGRYDNSVLRNRDVKVVITSHNLLAKQKDIIATSGFDIYIADECSKFKNHMTGQTKAMLSICRRMEKTDIFMPMSGTVLENRLEEAYPILAMIDEPLVGSWSNFRNHYTICDFFGNVVGYKNQKLLKYFFDNFMIRRTSDLVWKERPSITWTNRICEMSKVQAQVYKDMCAAKVNELLKDSICGKVSTAQAISLILYSSMIADTAESVLDPKKINKSNCHLLSCKMDALHDILFEETSSNKIVVFCRFANHVIPHISKALKKWGVEHHVVTGGTKDREGVKKKFKADKSRVLLCSDSLSYGANLQSANYLINFDLPWNPAVTDQRVARIFRRGQKRAVTVINFIAAGTVDEDILEKNYSKRDLTSSIIGAGTVMKDISKKNEVSSAMKVLDAIIKRSRGG